MLKLNSSELAQTAMLTCVNSVSELIAGGFLHLIDFSMKGSVMTGINLMVYSLLLYRVPKFGVITVCGFGTAAVNFLLAGGMKFFAIYTIIVEAFVIDCMLNRWGLNRASLIAAGIAAGLTACLCGLFNGIVFMGAPIADILQRLAQSSMTLGQPIWVLAAFILVWRILAGVAFGLVSFKVIETMSPELDKMSGHMNAVDGKAEVNE